MRFAKGAVAVLAAMMMTVMAQAAMADESGTFRSLRSYHHDYTTIDHGGRTFTGGMITGTGTVIESSGGPFMEGSNRYSECLVFSSSVDGSLSLLEAPCADTDASGDILYSRAVRKEGEVVAGGGGPGVWELLGGTGKYAGVTGTCSYETEYLEDVLVTIADCTWSKA